MRLFMFSALALFLVTALLSGCTPEKGPTDPAWYCYAETQCHDPWRSLNGDLETQVTTHLEDNGVKALDFEVEQAQHDSATCMACTCPSGRTIKVLVPQRDHDTIEALDLYPVGGWTVCISQ